MFFTNLKNIFANQFCLTQKHLFLIDNFSVSEKKLRILITCLGFFFPEKSFLQSRFWTNKARKTQQIIPSKTTM